jgi:hypothetical protein
MATPSRAAAARIIGGVLLGLGALVALTTGRLVLESREHLEEGERLARAGERAGAAVELEEAVRAHVPGSPYPRRAFERLALMAKGQEMRGETEFVAATWEAARRAVLSTRHLLQPNSDALERAERELRRLRGGPGRRPATAINDPAARPDDPSPVLSLLLAAGLLAWIGGSLGLIVTARGRSDRRAAPRVRVAAWLLCLGGLATWLALSWMIG